MSTYFNEAGFQKSSGHQASSQSLLWKTKSCKWKGGLELKNKTDTEENPFGMRAASLELLFLMHLGEKKINYSIKQPVSSGVLGCKGQFCKGWCQSAARKQWGCWSAILLGLCQCLKTLSNKQMIFLKSSKSDKQGKDSNCNPLAHKPCFSLKRKASFKGIGQNIFMQCQSKEGK